jgi:hypothetical protein
VTWYQPENTEEDEWVHAVYGATIDITDCCKINPLTGGVDVRACAAEIRALSSYDLYWKHAPLLLLFWSDQIAGFAPRTGIRTPGPKDEVERAAQELIATLNRMSLTRIPQHERYHAAIDLLNYFADHVVETAMVFTASLVGASLATVSASPADLIKAMQLIGHAQAALPNVPDEVINHCARGIVRGHAEPERLRETWPCLVDGIAHETPGWTVPAGLTMAVRVMRQAFLRLRDLRGKDAENVTGYLPADPAWVGKWWDDALDPANSNADVDECLDRLTANPDRVEGKVSEVLTGAAVALRALLPYVSVQALSVEGQLRTGAATV